MSVDREIIDAPGVPPAVGPYSHAVRSGSLLFCSMQIALDLESGEIVGDTAAKQITICMERLQMVAQAAGASLADAVKVTVYVTDIGQFAAVNDAYGAFFTADPPARGAVEVSALPRGAQVAADAIIAAGR
jgi:2-iminobutanoate/2-iminopropanoate deaminase